jgi:hypothetical protein
MLAAMRRASSRVSLVAGEQLGRRAASGLILEVDVGERLPVGIADAARTGGAPMLMAVEEM